jgi:hypothetical protein
MSDIIERAEKFANQFDVPGNRGRSEVKSVIADLIAALKSTRAENEQLVWYITTDLFEFGGLVVAGPFPTVQHALRMRDAIERRGGHLTYWIDKRPWTPAAEQSR